MTERILTLPAQLRRSITWDQGKEMTEHVRFTVQTGVQIYFCVPQEPVAARQQREQPETDRARRSPTAQRWYLSTTRPVVD
jgi:IS30 family transposase